MAGTERIVGDVVCDAGPLIHLHELECLDLLEDAGRLLISGAVWHEIEHHDVAGALSRLSVRCSRIAEDANPVHPRVHALSQLFSLHEGERQCIALCLAKPDCMFLTDDLAARLAAKTAGIRVHGTIGVIIRSLRTQRRTRAQVVAALESIPDKSTLFISRSILNEAIVAILPEESS